MKWLWIILLFIPFLINGQGIIPLDNQLPTEKSGGVPVNIQDQTTRPLDLYFLQQKGIPTTLNAPTAIDDTTIIVTSRDSINAGDFIGIFSGTSLEDHFYFAEVLSASADTVELDSPLDFAFDSLDPVISTSREMNVNGAGDFQTFSVTNGTAATTIEIDLTRILFHMITATGPNIAEFGDLTALTRGIVLRRNNGVKQNIWNAKSNGDFLTLMYDVSFYYAAGPGPQGSDGVGGRFSFAGQDKHGVTVRLAGGESLDLIIQDDLSGLTSFRMIAEGHIVTD